MARKRKPIIKHWRLEINQYDLVCCVAETLDEGMEAVARNYDDMEDLRGLMGEGSSVRAKTLAKRGQGVILLFRFDKLHCNILCHEVTHATHFFMEWMGVTLSDSSDEVFAYYNDMLFRFVAQWWQEQRLKVLLSTPPVPEMIYKPRA